LIYHLFSYLRATTVSGLNHSKVPAGFLKIKGGAQKVRRRSIKTGIYRNAPLMRRIVVYGFTGVFHAIAHGLAITSLSW